MINKRALRTGDGCHFSVKGKLKVDNEEPERDVEHFWGWNDELLTTDDKKDVTIINKTE